MGEAVKVSFVSYCIGGVSDGQSRLGVERTGRKGVSCHVGSRQSRIGLVRKGMDVMGMAVLVMLGAYRFVMEWL